MLNNPITTASAMEAMWCAREGCASAAARRARSARARGGRRANRESSKQARIGTMVSQFRRERLPLKIRNNWNVNKKNQAVHRHHPGANTNQDATNSTKKFHSAPNFWNQCGWEWQRRLNGFGMGCVS